MSSVLKSLLGAFCAVVLLAACSSSGSSPVTSASFEPENVLTLGRGASDPSAAPAPVATAPVAAEAMHSTTEAAHGGEHESGGLPQFEFQHWFGQIVYLIFLFAILYLLIAKIFAPRMRRVFDERSSTISTAVQTARQVQAEAADQLKLA